MRAHFFLVTSLLLVGCASNSTSRTANSPIETVKFVSTPSDAIVTIFNEGKDTVSQTCQTPCSLVLDTSKTMSLKMEKPGYITTNIENLFYKDPKLEALTSTMIIAMTGKPFRAGQLTVKGELLTPEQKIERETELKGKVEQKLQEEARIKTALADKILAKCGVDEGNTTSTPDPNVQPLIRMPAIMPPEANKSGHCDITMNVNKSGRISDAVATYCTDDLFRDASIRSVLKWVYSPRLVEGQPVDNCGITTKVSFKLYNEKFKLLPE